ncbi:STAS domain-containing protein [Nonomuraea soli]|uniref:Anti-sigma factor antagonist n=1 Tax=Nonomuraea soli TaxID=1032476 RepID=A0A7W0HVQ1_9ACTN|nr:STAS domain-containing protein [Nonomuraea soli]MBA2897415.1 anti-sigma B factor antagonist [Nonomuraea soli]
MSIIDTASHTWPSAATPTHLQLSGDIDIFTTDRLRQRLISTLAYSTDLLVLDMSRVTFFGAGGLGVLIGVQARAQRQGITVALTGIPPRVARLLRITGLNHRFPTIG